MEWVKKPDGSEAAKYAGLALPECHFRILPSSGRWQWIVDWPGGSVGSGFEETVEAAKFQAWQAFIFEDDRLEFLQERADG